LLLTIQDSKLFIVYAPLVKEVMIDRLDRRCWRRAVNGEQTFSRPLTSADHAGSEPILC
jgi:hypothetical protein